MPAACEHRIGNHAHEPDGTAAVPAFQLLEERVKPYTPEWAEGITGIPAATIRRLAHEMGITARDQKIELPIAWTDSWGQKHESVKGNPVSFHAMRGLAASMSAWHSSASSRLCKTSNGGEPTQLVASTCRSPA